MDELKEIKADDESELDRLGEGVNECMTMMGMGVTRAAIVRKLQEKYGISHVSAYKWFKRASREMLPKNDEERQEIRADISAALSFAQRHAVAGVAESAKDGDYKDRKASIDALVAVVDRRAKLFGLNEEIGGGAQIIQNNTQTNISIRSSDIRDRILKTLGVLSDSTEPDGKD